MKKSPLLLMLLLLSTPSFAMEFNSTELNDGGLNRPHETPTDFESRLRDEMTCTNYKDMYQEYRSLAAEVDHAVTDSFSQVNRALYQWDNELYYKMGRSGYRYSGALGRFANDVDYWVRGKLAPVQHKLQIFAGVFLERVQDCLKK